MYKDSLFSTSLLTFVICVLFDDILTQMISDCSFDLHFSDVVMLSTFSFACWPFSCLLWRNDDMVLLLIFKLSCSFCWCSVVWAVYIVWILTSYQSCHLQIFSSIQSIFVLSVASFAVKKLSSLIRSYLFSFGFISLAFILLSLLQQNEHVVYCFIHSFFSDTVPFHLLHNSYNNLPFSLHLLIVVCLSY